MLAVLSQPAVSASLMVSVRAVPVTLVSTNCSCPSLRLKFVGVGVPMLVEAVKAKLPDAASGIVCLITRTNPRTASVGTVAVPELHLDGEPGASNGELSRLHTPGLTC